MDPTTTERSWSGSERAEFPELPSARDAIRRLAAFGWVLRGDFGPASDIDLLVEFEPGHVPGLLVIAGMELELERLLGRPVDLRTCGDLSRYFRDQVRADAQELYAA